MPAADPIITDLSTWDATTWLAAVAALIALGALVTAVFARLDSRRSSRAGEDSAEAAKRSASASERSAMTGEAAVQASQRSADAAERAAALQERQAQLQATDRHEAAGPQFAPVGDSVVGDDLTAEVKLRIEGGPGAMDLELETDGPSWCVGLSSTRGGIPSVLIVPVAYEPGSVVTFYVHIAARPWADDDPAVLAVVVTATTDIPYRRWQRRVSVPVVPPGPVPLAVPPDSDRLPPPEW